MIKSKFKIGQRVWHINRGFLISEVVKGMAYDDDNESVKLYFVQPNWNYSSECSFYRIDVDEVFDQDNIFASRKDLLSSLSKEEVDEE